MFTGTGREITGRGQNQRAVQQSKSTRGKGQGQAEIKKPENQSEQGEGAKENPQTDSRQAGFKTENKKPDTENTQNMLEPGVGRKVQVKKGIRRTSNQKLKHWGLNNTDWDGKQWKTPGG